MATSPGSSNLKKPWAWLAAIAVFAIAIASSTALYVVNPAVKLQLPWWAAVAAPALVYGLVLPLCVPRMRIGGWLAGFFTLAVLHSGIALTTAWFYARVGFIPFEEALAPALWGFPPALVLAMVGSLVMILPFLGALAPRPSAARAQAAAGAPPHAGSTKPPRQAPEITPSKDRQAWARASTGSEHESAVSTAVAQAVGTLPAMSVAGPALAETPPELEEHPPAATGSAGVVPEEPAVHAAPLSSGNGGAPDTAPADAPPAGFDDLPADEPAVNVPDFRQALSELFGEPAAPPAVEETREAPDELVAPEPSFAAAPAAAAPAESEAMVRIPFDRVVGQLPPGAFRVPLGQVGARLRVPDRLVVPQDLVVPQLGEGVVQVAWEVVVEQFPAAVFAVAPAEVKERIVNGRLLLPLDEIVRQLPPEVFAASIGRGPVEVPGIESFPAPFKPPGWEEKPAMAAPPRGEPEALSPEPLSPEPLSPEPLSPEPLSPEPLSPEPLSIEVPDVADVARDLAQTPPEPEASVEELKLAQPPTEPELAAASLLEETRPAEAEEAPQNVLEIEEVAEVLDLDLLLEGTKALPASEAVPAPAAPAPPAVEETREAPDELVAPEPSFAAAPAAAAPAESEAMVRIPFDRVVGQLPPGAFRVPLGQVGARLRVPDRLVVPQDLVVPQLGEGVVQVAWEVVVEQFPAAVFAVAPAEVKERIVNGRLLLPLDEIVRQLPPEVFAASIGRGPVEVPGIESFPAPFKPLGWEAPLAPPVGEPASVTSAAQPAVPQVESAPEPALEAAHEPAVEEPAAASPAAAEALVDAAPPPAAATPADAAQPAEAAQPADAAQPAEAAQEEAPAQIQARVIETPSIPELRVEPAKRPGNAEKIAALMAPWETAAFNEVQVGDFAIISVSAAGLAGSAVAAAAGRLSAIIARRAPRPIEQATLRGVGGTLVLTPVGSGWNTGTALAVGSRPGAPLARLEILARRAAAAHHPDLSADLSADLPAAERHDVTPAASFDAASTPPAAAAAVEDLQAFGPLAAQSYRESSSGALIHCFIPPGASAAELAPFAWELAQAMAQGSQAGPLGSFHSAVLRSGRERLEIRRLPSAAGPAPILVVEGADTGRPGLARLQVERAAARLGAA